MELIKNGTRVLCLSPHPDDVEFGIGATLSKFKGDFEGRLIIFSDRLKSRGEKNNDSDQMKAAQLIGFSKENIKFIDQLGLDIDRLPVRLFGDEKIRDLIRHIVANEIKYFNPELIFIPSIHETFQDHEAIAVEVKRVARGEFSLLGYEAVRHSYFFQPNVFIDVNENHLDKKIEAINTFTEFTNRYYFEGDLIKSLARVRAAQAGYAGFAEAFEIYRLFVT